MDDQFRKAAIPELPVIWDILKQAILRRKQDGSNQWQDGYPNPEVVRKDIEKNVGYVLVREGIIVGYAAILINDEPAYASIDGQWLTNENFVVVHRVAIAEMYLKKGLATKIFEFAENVARANKIKSVKADTNFDNPSVIKIFEKLGYSYCGEVYFRGSARKAFEKVLL